MKAAAPPLLLQVWCLPQHVVSLCDNGNMKDITAIVRSYVTAIVFSVCVYYSMKVCLVLKCVYLLVMLVCVYVCTIAWKCVLYWNVFIFS